MVDKMYHRQLGRSIFCTEHNLRFYRIPISESRIQSYSIANMVRSLRSVLRNSNSLRMFRCGQPQGQNSSPRQVMKVWARQLEFVMAQRLRRCQQMFSVYSKIWEERALKELLRRMRVTFFRRSKEFILGATVYHYNWEDNRIKEEEMRQHLNEFDYIRVLKENTICLACDPTKTIVTETKQICKCAMVRKAGSTYDKWETFITQPDLLVWRRMHSSGYYEYKVYGTYNDVTAEDFLNVQVDTKYRRTWDTTAVVLEVAEEDPATESNSDIIYWEMLWPRLFVNRDYVFNRRYLIDHEKNTIVMFSKSTQHPNFPPNPEKFRIKDYFSCMVIKPYSTMHELGVEFSLTYFDNPGVNIPTTVTNWVAMRAMPDFLGKLRQAAKKYKQYCQETGTGKLCNIAKSKTPKDEVSKEKELDFISFIPTKKQGKWDLSDWSKNELRDSLKGKKEVDSVPPPASDGSSLVQNDKATGTFWKYFRPKYYFQ